MKKLILGLVLLALASSGIVLIEKVSEPEPAAFILVGVGLLCVAFYSAHFSSRSDTRR